MARKRKSEATPRLDEVDRTLYSTFCGAANSLSQLYTQAMNNQKTTFQAGERHAYEKLYHWIMRQHEEGSRVTVTDVLCHIQNEMDNGGGEDATMSPRILFQPQHPQPTTPSTNFVSQSSFGAFGQEMLAHGNRCGNTDQTKNSIFSNALSSPVRRSLQPYHLAQGGGYYPNIPSSGSAGGRNQDPNQSRDSNSPGNNDASMDMHSDTPPHDSY